MPEKIASIAAVRDYKRESLRPVLSEAMANLADCVSDLTDAGLDRAYLAMEIAQLQIDQYRDLQKRVERMAG